MTKSCDVNKQQTTFFLIQHVLLHQQYVGFVTSNLTGVFFWFFNVRDIVFFYCMGKLLEGKSVSGWGKMQLLKLLFGEVAVWESIHHLYFIHDSFMIHDFIRPNVQCALEV